MNLFEAKQPRSWRRVFTTVLGDVVAAAVGVTVLFLFLILMFGTATAGCL